MGPNPVSDGKLEIKPHDTSKERKRNKLDPSPLYREIWVCESVLSLLENTLVFSVLGYSETSVI